MRARHRRGAEGANSPEPLRRQDHTGQAPLERLRRGVTDGEAYPCTPTRQEPHVDAASRSPQPTGDLPDVRRPPHRPVRGRRRRHARGRRPAARLDALVDRAVPGAIRSDGAAALDAGARREAAVVDELRALAAPQHGDDLDDRARLLRHAHPGRGPAQRAGEPRLVHRLHAVPAGDLPGPARGAAQLPDRRQRPHRPADRRRLAARRVAPRPPRR